MKNKKLVVPHYAGCIRLNLTRGLAKDRRKNNIIVNKNSSTDKNEYKNTNR